MKNYYELRKEYIKLYSAKYELNDPAHTLDHFDEVYEVGTHLQKKTGYRVAHHAIFLVAYFHDLFAWSRENHHEMSGLFIETTECPFIEKMLGLACEEIETISPYTPVSKEQMREWVSGACREHRASFKGEHTSLLSDLMASADRGFPTGVKPQVLRAYRYYTSRFPQLSFEEHCQRVADHMLEKFSSDGYAFYPFIYEEVFGVEVDRTKRAMDRITPAKVVIIVMEDAKEAGWDNLTDKPVVFPLVYYDI